MAKDFHMYAIIDGKNMEVTVHEDHTVTFRKSKKKVIHPCG